MPRDSEPEGHGGAALGGVVEDLFLTETFLVKGRTVGKHQRLSKVLEDLERTYVTVEDATLVALNGREVIRTPRVQIAQREIVFAHELVDMASDSSARQLAADDKTVRMRAFYAGTLQMELAGRASPRAYEPSQGPIRRWFVLLEPVIRGLDVSGREELRVLDNLGYAIVQKGKPSYVYDFG